jgi:glycosyltransferase involved in cell wall biosynthesis
VFALTIPSKVQSYLMASVPLLGMLDGEGAAVIAKANAGLVCSAGSSAGLAQAVSDLLAMPKEERKRLGDNGRAYAEKEFGREMLITRLEAWFAEVLANTGRQDAVRTD